MRCQSQSRYLISHYILSIIFSFKDQVNFPNFNFKDAIGSKNKRKKLPPKPKEILTWEDDNARSGYSAEGTLMVMYLPGAIAKQALVSSSSSHLSSLLIPFRQASMANLKNISRSFHRIKGKRPTAKTRGLPISTGLEKFQASCVVSEVGTQLDTQ